jgi:hypothetical protein
VALNKTLFFVVVLFSTKELFSLDVKVLISSFASIHHVAPFYFCFSFLLLLKEEKKTEILLPLVRVHNVYKLTTSWRPIMTQVRVCRAVPRDSRAHTHTLTRRRSGRHPVGPAGAPQKSLIPTRQLLRARISRINFPFFSFDFRIVVVVVVVVAM